jgi:hypothetical protein
MTDRAQRTKLFKNADCYIATAQTRPREKEDTWNCRAPLNVSIVVIDELALRWPPDVIELVLHPTKVSLGEICKPLISGEATFPLCPGEY